MLADVVARRRTSVALPAMALTFALALNGCLPSRPLDPVAIGLQSDEVEVMYTACERQGVSGVKVVLPDPDKNWIEEDAPIVWQIVFESPAIVESIIIGSQPAGARTLVPLREPLEPKVMYAAFLLLEDGNQPYEIFVVDKLENGSIRFEMEYLSSSEFEKRTSCE